MTSHEDTSSALIGKVEPNAGLRGIGAIGPAYWPDWAAPHLTTDGTHPSAGGAVWMASAITRAMGVP